MHGHSGGGGSGSGRRWCIPSAILRSPAEALDGIGILHEFDGELGLTLWYAVRDVTLWASAPDPVRHGLFGPCSTAHLTATTSSVPEALRAPLETLAAMLAMPGADAELLSLCCLEVAAWARGRKAPRTALAYAQAGAVAAPEFSEAALQTAICALELRETMRAETWLRRAVAVARRERNWPVYATAYVLLGTLYRQQGKVVQAERYLLMGFRVGRRASVHLARRDAAYGLFRLAVERGDATSSARLAIAAQRAYRKEQAHSAPLLLDLARFWMEQDQAGRARAALGRLAMHVGELTRQEALAAAALTAWALAETKASHSKAAEARAWRILSDEATTDDAALAAALDLAHAAAARGDRESFDRATRTAHRVAPVERYDWTRSTLAALTRRAFPAPERSAHG
jgi:hypothetical protein